MKYQESKITAVERIFYIFTILILLTNCAGGGGGSSTSSSTTKYTYSETASAHKTTEYNNQYGLNSIKTAEGYAALGGYTEGGPVKVAVIDTGIDSDHTKLSDQIVSGGYDYYNEDTNPEDDHGHGTHVAGIIAAAKTGSGMHGIAPNADIIPIKVCSSGGSCPYTDITQGVDKAVAEDAKVINISLGGSSGSSELNTALEKAVNAGIVIAISAGNDGNTSPSYPARYAAESYANGLIFSVGSVNSSNAESGYNTPGSTYKSVHLVAPGTSIYSTCYDGSYCTKSGTSMAAPHVAGALALLREEFPNLTGKQIADLVWDNTTDLGDSGVDTTFGKGLLNLQASINANASSTTSGSSQNIPLTEHLDGDSASITDSYISLSNAFSNNIKKNNLLSNSIIIDGYYRAYRNDLTSGINIKKTNLPLVSFASLNQKNKFESLKKNILNFQSTSTIQYSPELNYNDLQFNHSEPKILNTEIHYIINDNSKINIIYNKNANVKIGLDQIEVFTNSLTLDPSTTLSNPYLSLIKKPINYSFEKHIDVNKKINSHIINSSLNQSYSFISEYTDTSFDNKFVSISLGYLNEDNAILGSTFNGAFGDLNNSETFFTDNSLALKINTNNEILLKTAYAHSKTNFNNKGLIAKFSDLNSSYYSLGYGKKTLFSDNDKAILSITRPLKVNRGIVDIFVPQYATSNNKILRENSNINLAPNNNQLNLEFDYNINNSNNNFNIGLISIINSNHTNKSLSENLFKFSYSYVF